MSSPLALRPILGNENVGTKGQGIIGSSTSSVPDRVHVEKGGLYTCLSNGKLERNIGECAGSGDLSHSPAERLGVELE
jgi:hypothetical protein